MSKILVIIQARMGSTRLPGKVLMELSGRPLIFRLIDSLKKGNHDLDFVVATSTNPENDCLVGTLEECGIKTYRGSENNVLSRFTDLIEQNQPDIVVRATADDPLMSAYCMDMLIDYLKEYDLDYTFMKGMPLGTSVEVVRAATLASLEEKFELTDLDREHVTYYIAQHTENFKVKCMEAPAEYHYPEMSFTIDTEQFQEISNIYDMYGEKTDLLTAIGYMNNEKM